MPVNPILKIKGLSSNPGDKQFLNFWNWRARVQFWLAMFYGKENFVCGMKNFFLHSIAIKFEEWNFLMHDQMLFLLRTVHRLFVDLK